MVVSPKYIETAPELTSVPKMSLESLALMPRRIKEFRLERSAAPWSLKLSPGTRREMSPKSKARADLIYSSEYAEIL